MNDIKYLIIHHEGTGRIIPDNEKRFKIVDDYHKSLGWGSCGYHYFIERDGIKLKFRRFKLLELII